MGHEDLMNGKYENTCIYLSYAGNLLSLASTVTGISSFTLLVAIPAGIKSFACRNGSLSSHCSNQNVM